MKYTIATASTKGLCSGEALILPLSWKGKQFRALVDTGANINAMNRALLPKNAKRTKLQVPTQVIAFDGVTVMDAQYSVTIKPWILNDQKQVTFFLLDMPYDFVLGTP